MKDIDLFKDIIIKEGRFNVYLLDLQVVYGRYSEEGLIAYRLNNRYKGIKEVQAFLLLKATDYLSGLIPGNTTVYSSFIFINPFPIQDINAGKELY